MTLTELFEQVNTAYRGSDDDAPTSGPDYDLWLATTRRKVQEWARDGKHTWNSLFSVDTIGTVTQGVQTYNLDTNFLLSADKVTVTTATDSFDFKLVEPQERDRFTDSCYISGANPQKLTFVDAFTADSRALGGTITLAGYFLPSELTAPTDVIPVDDPYWLVYAVASELAFNDESYDSKTGDLNAKANSLYAMMASNNRRGTSNNPRTVRTNVQRIQDTRSEARSY